MSFSAFLSTLGTAANAGYQGYEQRKQNSDAKRRELRKAFEEYKRLNPEATATDYQDYIRSIMPSDRPFLRDSMPSDEILRRLGEEGAKRKLENSLRQQLESVNRQAQTQGTLNALISDAAKTSTPLADALEPFGENATVMRSRFGLDARYQSERKRFEQEQQQAEEDRANRLRDAALEQSMRVARAIREGVSPEELLQAGYDARTVNSVSTKVKREEDEKRKVRMQQARAAAANRVEELKSDQQVLAYIEAGDFERAKRRIVNGLLSLGEDGYQSLYNDADYDVTSGFIINEITQGRNVLLDRQAQQQEKSLAGSVSGRADELRKESRANSDGALKIQETSDPENSALVRPLMDQLATQFYIPSDTAPFLAEQAVRIANENRKKLGAGNAAGRDNTLAQLQQIAEQIGLRPINDTASGQINRQIATLKPEDANGLRRIVASELDGDKKVFSSFVNGLGGMAADQRIKAIELQMKFLDGGLDDTLSRISNQQLDFGYVPSDAEMKAITEPLELEYATMKSELEAALEKAKAEVEAIRAQARTAPFGADAQSQQASPAQDDLNIVSAVPQEATTGFERAGRAISDTASNFKYNEGREEMIRKAIMRTRVKSSPLSLTFSRLTPEQLQRRKRLMAILSDGQSGNWGGWTEYLRPMLRSLSDDQLSDTLALLENDPDKFIELYDQWAAARDKTKQLNGN